MLLSQDLNWCLPIAQECRQAAKDAHFSEKQLKIDSQKAYFMGDYALAKQLSQDAKEKRNLVNKFNKIASNTTYLSHNHSLDQGMVDLDGLFKDEALFYLDKKVSQMNTKGEIKCLLKPDEASAFELDRMKKIVNSYAEAKGFQCNTERNDEFGDVLVLDMGLNPSRRTSGISTNDVFLLQSVISIDNLV